MNIETISFTELAKCYLLDRKFLEKSCLNCIEYLEKQIETLKPSIVITLGVIPKKVFSLRYEKEFEMGTLEEMEHFAYLPLYHPSPASPYGHKNNLKILKLEISQLTSIIMQKSGRP